MRIRYHLILALLLVLSLWTWAIQAQEADVRVIDDFEAAEVFEGRDGYNNAIGHAPWGDQAGNVALGLATMERSDVSSTVL